MTKAFLKNVTQVCRTCLKQVDDVSQIIYLHWKDSNLKLSYQQKLEQCITEIDLGIIPNSIICCECLAAVNFINTFKNTCLQTEQCIRSYMKKNASSSLVDLLQVVQWNEKQNLNINIKTTKKSKNVSDLINPVAVGEEHCYAKKGYGGRFIQQKQTNIQHVDALRSRSALFSIKNVTDDSIIQNINQILEIDPQIDATGEQKLISEVAEDPTLLGNYQFCTYSALNANKLLLHIQKRHSIANHTEELSKNKPLKCTICTFTCVVKTMLNDHTKMHTGEKHIKCDYCNYRCNFKSNLQNHMRVHTGKPNPFHCNLCKFSTPSRTNLTVHMRSHTGEKPFKCKECAFKCNNKNRLKFHNIVKHTEQTPFKCHLCNYSAKLKSYVVSHMKSHSRAKPFKCSEDNFEYVTKTDLASHNRSHIKEKQYKCESCDYKCTSMRALKNHKNIHLGKRLLKCEECEYSSYWNSSLNSHIKTHRSEGGFKCKECEYTCTHYYRLVFHKKIHAKVEPFRCVQCKFACADQHSLVIHTRFHPEKPYKCPECHYSTLRKNSLNVHVKTHTGEKPYKCVACPYKCSTQSKLTVHMKIHARITCYRCTRCEFRCKESDDFEAHMKLHSGHLVRMEFNRKIVPYKPISSWSTS